MQTYILRENVVSDNVLLIADYGKVFKGGFIAIVKEFEYQNAWNDREKPNKKFRSENTLNKFLNKHYPDFVY
mgnify:CR=1 FL=1|jgi:hypothetical protein